MKPMKRYFVLFALIAAATTMLPASASDGPFSDLSVDAALKAAKKDGKLVMIDFYTTWCGPCRMLDRMTWPNKDVKDWLGAHFVAVKVDCDRNRPMQLRHRVRSYPTMVFLKGDGKEIGRMVGYMPPKVFLARAKSVLKAHLREDADRPTEKTPSDSAGTAPNGSTYDRLMRARQLAEEGRHAEALEEMLWCYDHADQFGAGFGKIRLSFLLPELGKLAGKHPPARAALVRRRAEAEKPLAPYYRDADQAPPPNAKVPLDRALELAAIDRALGVTDKTVAVFDRLSAESPGGRAIRQAMFEDVLDPLLKAQRYADIVAAAGDVFGRIDGAIRSYREDLSTGRNPESNLAIYLRQQVCIEGGKYYEALLGTGRYNEATDLAERIIRFDPSPIAFSQLIDRAVRVRDFDAARGLVDQAERTLPESELAIVRQSAARVPRS